MCFEMNNTRQRPISNSNSLVDASSANFQSGFETKHSRIGNLIKENRNKDFLLRQTFRTQNSFKYQDAKNENEENKTNNLYNRLSFESTHCQRFVKEVILGKRIGFYRLKDEIGRGNFSQVRLGIHLLTHS